VNDGIRIGCGSAYADDWLEPAVALAHSGEVDYIAFDCLAERTMALAHVRRMSDPSAGQDQRISRVVELFAPFLAGGGTIIGSFGAANPDAAARDVLQGLAKHDVTGLRVGVIHGDDVLDQVLERDLELPEVGSSTRALADRIVSANAYIGADAILPLLQQGARFILGGRLADPSLYVAALCHELGWALDDWQRLGEATLVGHLLECGVHGAGGNFSDPPMRTVPAPWDLGTPYATVTPGGEVTITKLPDAGGAIDGRTVRAQLLYEILDPAAYLTPDVTADFSQVWIEEVGHDHVRVGGAAGRPRPDTLKVLVGLDEGYKGVAEASLGGPGCLERADLAEEIMRHRLARFGDGIERFRIDRHGVSALFEGQIPSGPPAEVRLRLALRARTRDVAEAAVREMEYLYFGPAGIGGITHSVVPAIGVTPAYLHRDAVPLRTEVVSS
jgi:hypothetical protein